LTRKYNPWTEQEAAIIAANAGRLTVRQVADLLADRSRKDVKAKAHHMGITLKRAGLYHNPSWTDEAVRRIRELARETSLTSSEIADIITEEFGVTRTAGAVRMVANRDGFSIRTGENL